MDMANSALDWVKMVCSCACISSWIASRREDRRVTAMSKAFWQKAEFTPFSRICFSRDRIRLSFLSFFTSCRVIPGCVWSIWISRFTSARKPACIFSRLTVFFLVGSP